MERILTTGDLARATGETVRTVRFYEEQGLLAPSRVSEGGHRRYDGNSLERLQLILDLRELGLSIPDVRAMLAMREGCRTAGEFRGLLRDRLPTHLARARERIERMKRLEAELRLALRTVSGFEEDAAGAPCPCDVAESEGAPRIVRVLARTGECAGRRHTLIGGGAGGSAGVEGPDGAARRHA
jgi:DNA-binding transcriptional MerR regulator